MSAGKKAWFPVVCALLLLSGCPTPQYVEIDEALGVASWSDFLTLNKDAGQKAGPYNASVNFRLELPEESHALGAYIWSNGALPTHRPLRLDLRNPVGGTIAKLLEEKDFFLIFDIENNQVIVSQNPKEALSALGLPLPFLLGDISLLLNGRYADFFLGLKAETQRPRLLYTTYDKRSVFKLAQGPLQGDLALDARGRPARWQGEDAKAWVMELEYQEAAKLTGPQRIKFSHPDGYFLSLQVKTLKKLSKPFAGEQLSLPVPPAATVSVMSGTKSKQP